MTVVATTDLSDYKSRRANKSISLIEQFGVYAIITFECASGWFGYRDVRVVDTFAKYNHAVNCYIKNGGQMRRSFDNGSA